VKTSIELNGRMYDATTGRLLSKDINTSPQKAPTTFSNGAFLDGIRRRSGFKKTHKPSTQAHAQSNNKKSSLSDTKPSWLAKKSRTFLKNPVNSDHIHHKQTHEHNLQLLKRVHEAKQARAAQTTVNKKVARFGNPLYHKPKLTSDYPVAKPPARTVLASTPTASKKKKLFRKSPKQEVFIHHILKANNHLAPKFRKPKFHARVAKALRVRPKILGASAACLAIFMLASFFAYQNIPSVAMRVAASRAGFSGHFPENTPAGFAFKGPIFFTKGAISLSYKSNTDNRKFTITQKPTDWTSETLMTDFLMASRLQYQTFHDKGLTVYIYSEGSATWVDKGVWYSISSSGALSSDQILAIAGSM